MSRKFLPVLLVLTAASVFLAFKSQGRSDDTPKTKKEKILRTVGLLLEQGHYSPKKIDDAFSKQVLDRFIKNLDDDKSIFLQADLDSFKVYVNKIDDEIHGNRLESFYAISQSYTRRLNEASKYFDNILSKPIDFTKDEKVMMDAEKLNFPANEAARQEVWRKRLKYLVLAKYVELIDERDRIQEKKKSKVATDTTIDMQIKNFVYKADSTLEREARGIVRKQIDRYFTTMKTHNSEDELFSTFVNAITGEMDPHTDYFAPVDSRGFNEMMSGKFYGIGAQLKEEENKIKIAALVTGMPAWKSGELTVNDEIIKIGQGKEEPVDVTGYAVSDAVKLIRGAQAGSEVRLTIRKPDGNIKVVSLLRGEIKLEDTYAKSAVINGEHKIGYIYLPEFYVDFNDPKGAKCSEDVAREIEKLKADHVEGIVIDLRGNGGGSLPEVVKMAGLFIEDGPICQVRGRDEKQPYLWKDRDKGILYDGPLTVMVDEGSASASEIFAAAIQDYKRGIIIGSTSTFGKGTVQRTIPLSPENESNLFGKKNEDDLGTVKLTLQKFYRVNGGATQLKGVTPDIVIPDRYEYYKSREKDNKTSLTWDEINKADYQPWTVNYSTDAVVNAAKEQVNSSATFQQLKAKIEWINKENDKEFPLNLTKYKEEQKMMKLAYKSLDSLYKLSKNLDITNNQTDANNIRGEKDKEEKSKQFISRIKGDIYLDETVKVMNQMIKQSNLAVNGAGAGAAETKKIN